MRHFFSDMFHISSDLSSSFWLTPIAAVITIQMKIENPKIRNLIFVLGMLLIRIVLRVRITVSHQTVDLITFMLRLLVYKLISCFLVKS